MTAASDPPAPPSSTPARAAGNGRALVAILLGVAIASLDTSIVNVALPVIAADLDASPATAIWVINAYQLAVVATLLPFAALGDRYGPRRIYIGGLSLFTITALACALATSLPALTAARALQGVAVGAMMSVNLALIRIVVPPERLGRGVGLNALFVGIGFAGGPSVASLVLGVASWPWLFGIGSPLALLTLLVAWQTLPQSARRGHGFDAAAALYTALTFAALIAMLSAAAQRQPAPLVLSLLAAVLVFGTLLLRRQRGHPAPMLPLDLMRRPLFALSVATAVFAFATQGLAFVALPFLLMGRLNFDAVATGLLMTPWPIVVALAAPIAGRLSDRHPPGLLGGIGMAILAIGMAAMVLLPESPTAVDIGWRMAVCGIGFGFFQSPNLRALMSSAPPERSGGASGMVGVARLTGQAGGAAIVALCFGLAGDAGPVWALGVGAVFSAVAAAASIARLRYV